MQHDEQQKNAMYTIHSKVYAYLHNLSVRELRELARHYGIRQASTNKLGLISRITLFAMERLESPSASPSDIFSVLAENSFEKFIDNWGQIEDRVPSLPELEFLKKAAERRPSQHNNHAHASPSVFDTQKFVGVNSSGLTHTRESKRGYQNGDISRSVAMQTNVDVVDSAPLSDSEFGRLLVLFRYNSSTRQHFLESMQCHMEANTSGMDTRLSYWTRVVEPSYNCESIQSQVTFPSYIPSTIDASAKPGWWRSGHVLRKEWMFFSEQFTKTYRGYEAWCTTGYGLHEYCLAQNVDFKSSMVIRLLMCGFLLGLGTGQVDDTLLRMLSCNVPVASDAVSQVGFSGERRNIWTESENDAPTSLNSTDYEDITRNMLQLLNVLKERVSQCMSEGSGQVNGSDFVKVIEQKESLLCALTRAKQKAQQASTAELKSLWMQHAEDIRNMLNVLSAKK